MVRSDYRKHTTTQLSAVFLTSIDNTLSERTQILSTWRKQFMRNILIENGHRTSMWFDGISVMPMAYVSDLPISFPLGSFVRTLCVGLPQASDCKALFKSLSGISVCWLISCKVKGRWIGNTAIWSFTAAILHWKTIKIVVHATSLFNHFNSSANDAGQTRLMMALRQDKKKLAQTITAVSFKMSSKERFSCTLLSYARCFSLLLFGGGNTVRSLSGRNTPHKSISLGG